LKFRPNAIFKAFGNISPNLEIKSSLTATALQTNVEIDYPQERHSAKTSMLQCKQHLFSKNYCSILLYV